MEVKKGTRKRTFLNIYIYIVVEKCGELECNLIQVRCIFLEGSWLLGFLLFYLEHSTFILEQQFPLPNLLFTKNNGAVNEFRIEYWLFFKSGWLLCNSHSEVYFSWMWVNCDQASVTKNCTHHLYISSWVLKYIYSPSAANARVSLGDGRGTSM